MTKKKRKENAEKKGKKTSKSIGWRSNDDRKMTRETDRQTDRQRDTETQRETETQTDRQTETKTETKTDTETQRQTDRQADGQTYRRIYRELRIQNSELYYPVIKMLSSTLLLHSVLSNLKCKYGLNIKQQ